MTEESPPTERHPSRKPSRRQGAIRQGKTAGTNGVSTWGASIQGVSTWGASIQGVSTWGASIQGASTCSYAYVTRKYPG